MAASSILDLMWSWQDHEPTHIDDPAEGLEMILVPEVKGVRIWQEDCLFTWFWPVVITLWKSQSVALVVVATMILAIEMTLVKERNALTYVLY